MSRRGNLLIGWLLALAGIALFARLGLWQLERMHAKQAMLDAVSSVLEQRQAQPLASAADPARSGNYDWSAGSGRFATLPPVVLDNQGREQRPGVRAYRVFVPTQGTPLLVELGWLPLPGDRTLPAVPLPRETTQVSGLLSPPPSPGLATAPAVAQADGTLLAIALRPDALAAQLGLAALSPRVLKLDPAQSLPADGPAYARDLDILPNTLPPDRHLGYAV
ncbi:SURF1 family protein, partial [Luteimonas sp. 8-5]|uniref:SURF1 family protein n=1 Tax=Luteimonas sp. 8-5 TaxID=3039387 RepID=UPI002436C217